MRTTLAIDDDLLRQLKDRAHRTGQPLKKVVNEAYEPVYPSFGSRPSQKNTEPEPTRWGILRTAASTRPSGLRRPWRTRDCQEAHAAEMKLVDLNLLIYAVNRDAPHHAAARRWWEDCLSGSEPIGLAWLLF